jgi:hypothetical protein
VCLSSRRSWPCTRMHSSSIQIQNSSTGEGFCGLRKLHHATNCIFEHAAACPCIHPAADTAHGHTAAAHGCKAAARNHYLLQYTQPALIPK